MSFLDRSGQNLLGVGVYTLPQAARLVRLRSSTVEKIVGPEPNKNVPARSRPVVIVDLDLSDDQKVVSFLGLMDLWVATVLHSANVSWPMIRIAASEARRILQVKHPFASATFRTDQKRVFMSLRDMKRQPKTIIDLIRKQDAFFDVIERTLSDDIVVRDESGQPLIWLPRGPNVQVVIDPRRRFGQPIDPISGVPTSALAEAFWAEGGDISAVSFWFGVDEKAVSDAVSFEEWLKAA